MDSEESVSGIEREGIGPGWALATALARSGSLFLVADHEDNVGVLGIRDGGTALSKKSLSLTSSAEIGLIIRGIK